MITLDKIDNNKLNIETNKDIKDIYLCNIDDKDIGYIVTMNNDNDMIHINVNEEYRSMGYGKIIFQEALKLFNKDIVVKTNNERMMKIINSISGKEVSRCNGFVTFIIKNS